MKEHPTIMRKPPLFDKIVIGKIRNKKYILTGITENLVNIIRESFENISDKDPSFSIRVGDDVISSDDVIVYGNSLEDVFEDGKSTYMDHHIEMKLRDIITHHAALTVPTPVDLKNKLVGNKLNTAATIGQAYLYYLLLIDVPDNIIIYEE